MDRQTIKDIVVVVLFPLIFTLVFLFFMHRNFYQNMDLSQRLDKVEDSTSKLVQLHKKELVDSK